MPKANLDEAAEFERVQVKVLCGCDSVGSSINFDCAMTTQARIATEFAKTIHMFMNNVRIIRMRTLIYAEALPYRS